MTQKEVKQEVSVEFDVDGSHIRLTPSIVQNYIVGSDSQITMQEFKFFTELCKVRKLNPFTKEAYLIKFGTQPAQIVVGKDAILKRAILNKNFNGRQQGVIILTDKNEVIERNGTFKLPTEKLVGGWAKVYRKDWDFPVYITVAFDEVAQKKKDGTLNSNWSEKGATMVEKVALVRALREAFVEDLGGMIDEDEAWLKEEPRANKTPITPQKDVFDVDTEEVKESLVRVMKEYGQEVDLKELE